MKVKLKNYLGNQTQLTLKAQGDYVTKDREVLLKNGIEYQLQLESGQLKLYQGSTLIGTFDTFTIHPDKSSNLLSINKRQYKGFFQFTRETVGGEDVIRPINHIQMEEYLKGVVPFEMPALWEKEAVKAQTVAARSYALLRSGSMIDDTINYQVYGGYVAPPNADAAVQETEGLVLKDGHKLVDGVFSASNGGKTESNANAWGSAPMDYYVVKDDPYDPKDLWLLDIHKTQIDIEDKDLDNAHSWWESVQEKDQTITANIKNWLAHNGYKGKEIKITAVPELSFSVPMSGGRVTKGSITVEFLVKETNGTVSEKKVEFKDVSASKIRTMVGIRIMKSYLVEKTENTSEMIKIQGRGDGHGVGLSQWGARNRAKAGHGVTDILGFYFPGAKVVKAYEHVSVGVFGMKDVPLSHRFYPEMTYLLNQKVIEGFPNGDFRPSQTVTRAQAAIMIGKALNLDGTKRKTTFDDVASTSTASGYIASAVNEDIITGFPDGSFRPGDTVTRGQMAILLSRAFELTEEAHYVFNDIPEDSKAYIHVKRIIAEGIAEGYPDGSFQPDRLLNRAEFAAFMARALNEEFRSK